MCASGSQNTIQSEQIQQYQQMQEMTAAEYAGQQTVLGAMQPMFESIFQAGPSQEGFSAQEKENLTSQAVSGTAANFKRAATAAGNELGTESGGLPSGTNAAVAEDLGAKAAGEESQEETQIAEGDYAQGRQNWESAAQGLFNIANQDNPLGYAQATTSSGSAAATTAEEIAQENSSWENAAIGAVGSIGGGFATGWGKEAADNAA
jgi:hypothetical protein